MYHKASVTDGRTSCNKENSASDNDNIDDDDDDDDDEFYECESDSPAAAATDMTESARSPMQCDDDAEAARDTSVESADSLLYQADGRLKQCNDLQLLNVNQRLYVPVTQEPAPMTEDMLEEHAEVLARYSLDHLTYLHAFDSVATEELG